MRSFFWNLTPFPFLHCMFIFVSIAWYRYWPIFQGADLVQKVYGRGKKEFMPAGTQCSCQVKHVTSFLLSSHVTWRLGLPSIMINIVEWLCKKQIHLFLQGQTDCLQCFQKNSKSMHSVFYSSSSWLLLELWYWSFARYCYIRQRLSGRWVLHHDIFLVDVNGRAATWHRDFQTTSFPNRSFKQVFTSCFSRYGMPPDLVKSPRIKVNGSICNILFLHHDLCVHNSSVIHCENRFCWRFGIRLWVLAPRTFRNGKKRGGIRNPVQNILTLNGWGSMFSWSLAKRASLSSSSRQTDLRVHFKCFLIQQSSPKQRILTKCHGFHQRKMCLSQSLKEYQQNNPKEDARWRNLFVKVDMAECNNFSCEGFHLSWIFFLRSTPTALQKQLH